MDGLEFLSSFLKKPDFALSKKKFSTELKPMLFLFLKFSVIIFLLQTSFSIISYLDKFFDVIIETTIFSLIQIFLFLILLIISGGIFYLILKFLKVKKSFLEFISIYLFSFGVIYVIKFIPPILSLIFITFSKGILVDPVLELMFLGLDLILVLLLFVSFIYQLYLFFGTMKFFLKKESNVKVGLISIFVGLFTIFLILVTPFLLPFETSSQNFTVYGDSDYVPPSYDVCSELIENSYLDFSVQFCYLDTYIYFAADEKNTFYCERIEIPYYHALCYGFVAKKIQNDNVCNLLSKEEILDISQSENDICKSISEMG